MHSLGPDLNTSALRRQEVVEEMGKVRRREVCAPRRT